MPWSAWADTKVEPSLSGSANLSYSRNPFLVDGGDTESGVFQFDIRPSVKVETETAAALINAYYTRTEYTHRFSSTDGYGGTFSYDRDVSSAVKLHGNASFDSSILGAPDAAIGGLPGAGTGGSGGGTTGPTTPGSPPTTGTGSDIGLIGLRQRRNEFAGQLGLDYQAGARSTWSFQANGGITTYPSGTSAVSSFDTYGGSIYYTRRFSETLEVGIRGDASATAYHNASTFWLYSPTLFVMKRLSSSFTFDTTLGLTYVHDTSSLGRDRTIFLGRANLCDHGQRSNLCLSFSRSATPTGFAGIRTQTVAGATFDHRLAEKTTLGVSGNYTSVGQSSTGLGGGEKYWTVETDVRHNLSRILTGLISFSYRDVRLPDRSVRPDLMAKAGLTLQLDRTR